MPRDLPCPRHAGAGSKTDRQQNGTTYSQFYHPWSGEAAGVVSLRVGASRLQGFAAC